MKILHICTYDKGGATTAALRLHLGLLKLGIHSKMLFLEKSERGNGIPKKTYYLGIGKSFLEKLFIKIQFKKTKHKNFKQLMAKNNNPGEVYALASSDYDITKHPAYLEADIINLHWVTGFIDYKTFFLKNNKPLVWTLHDQNAFTGICHYSGSCNKYTTNCSQCPILLPRDQKAVQESFNLKLNFIREELQASVVAPSKWLHACAKAGAVFKKQTHYHIPYGLDTTVFKPYDINFAREVFNLPKEKNIFLFVSDTIENKRKGFQIVLRTIEEINDSNSIFCVVGDSNIEYPNVVKLGRIYDTPLLALLFAASDAFILPSLEDNLPNTMLEAICCGTPVIAFNIGGIPDVVTHKKNGILCESNDKKGLKEGIELFMKQPFNRKEIAIQAHKRFNENVQAKAYVDLYKRKLNAIS